jgi:AcrR family transcriptional regulator
MNKRNEQKIKTRKTILMVAEKIFSERGFLAPSTAEIAKAAEISHGALFAHFPKRDDLIAAVLNETTLNIAKRLHKLAEKSPSLKEVLLAHLQGISEDENIYRWLIIEGPLLPAFARASMLGIQSAISKSVLEAYKRELLDNEKIKGNFLFNSWLGLIHHYLINRDLFTTADSIYNEKKDFLVNSFIKMIS